MRSELDADRVTSLLRAMGERATGSGRVYITGGATAVLTGWRQATVDADIKLDPEPSGLFEAIRSLKDELNVNVELASPDDFIPPLPGWRERSCFIVRFGFVDFYHYDFYGQVLSKLERGHDRDLADARAMIQRKLVIPAELQRLFDSIEPDLFRYPAIDAALFRQKVSLFLSEVRGG